MPSEDVPFAFYICRMNVFSWIQLVLVIQMGEEYKKMMEKSDAREAKKS